MIAQIAIVIIIADKLIVIVILNDVITVQSYIIVTDIVFVFK